MMKKVSTFIVEKRNIIYLLFIAAVVYCAMSVGKVQVNSDLTSFLPPETQTRRGLQIMEKEFTTYAGAEIMISNVTLDIAEDLVKKIEQVDGVSMVILDDTKEHFNSASALLTVSFNGGEQEERIKTALDQCREIVEEYDYYIDTLIGYDLVKEIAGQMDTILIVAILIIIGVLVFTSKSYFEVVVFLIVFGVAAVLNMGTNYLLGEISAITNSIAIILQLALAIDYAIIFCHRYQEDREVCDTAKEALIESLAKSIIEISSSSLTTVSGLLALTLMQFRIGYDLGIVLTKGILCSLITVFLLMPGLIMLFNKQIDKMKHKNLVPDISGWGRFLVRTKGIFAISLILVIPIAFYVSNKCDYVFAEKSIDAIRESDKRKAQNKIATTFERTEAIALLVPRGSYEKEKAVIKEVQELEKIRTVTALGAIEIEDGRMLTDLYKPRKFAELVDMDIEMINMMYTLYGLTNEQYQPIFGDVEDYAVPLLDIFQFMFEKIDQGMVELDEDKSEMINELRRTLDEGLVQLQGDDMVRMVFTAAVPTEGKESKKLVNDILEIAKAHYGDEEVLAIGEITSAAELQESFLGNNIKISVLTALFVFVILLFTFKSFGTALLLVALIQGSIWINFSFPVLTDKNLFFMAYLIVSAIQMGATIDYAIVMTNRFQTLKEEMDVKEAVARAVSDSFPTILTSGSIMIAAGFLIGYMTTDVNIGSIGLALGRGALISVILIMTALPQILLYGNKFMEKTRFSVRKLLRGEE